MKTKAFHKDEWLSGILKRPVYHLIDIADVDAVSGMGRDVFCDAKCKAGDIKTSRILSQAGFYVVDVNLYFETRSLKTTDTFWVVRAARKQDQQSIGDIAGRCFSYSRFHLDPFIPQKAANNIKQAWALNYFSGKRGDMMIVAENQGILVGFLQLIRKANGLWVVDLIGIEASVRGKGVGTAMFGAMPSLCGDIKTIGAGTQAANISAIVFYTKLGFILKRAQYIFHYHGDKI